MSRRGFTLLEVLAAVVVLVVLAVGVVPAWRSLADGSVAIHRQHAAEEVLFAFTADELWRRREVPTPLHLRLPAGPGFAAELEVVPLPVSDSGGDSGLEPAPPEAGRERFVLRPPARRWATARIRAVDGGAVLAERLLLVGVSRDRVEAAP